MNSTGYVTSLGDLDLVGSLEKIGGDLVGTVEEAVSNTAGNLVKQGQQAAESGVEELIRTVTGSDTPTSPAQPAETPVATSQPTSSMLSGLPSWAIPAGAGVAVYFWQKSFLWAGIAVVTAWFLTSRMGKGGKA